MRVLLLLGLIGLAVFVSPAGAESTRFQLQATELGFPPTPSGIFLRTRREELLAPMCSYALSIDSACASKIHDPCKKLLPIAFNFCSGEMTRLMQPHVISKAESLYWSGRFRSCMINATKSLVLNERRQQEYCSEPKEEGKFDDIDMSDVDLSEEAE